MKASDLHDEVLRIALLNAVGHDGKAMLNPVLGKLLSERPELKRSIQELKDLVERIVLEVNRLNSEEQKRLLEKYKFKIEVKPKPKRVEAILPPLPNVERYERVITRFSPNPDCVLHLGSARAIILCYEYAKLYEGLFYLRFEDTDPRLKKAALQFYDFIREDIKWLGCPWDAEFIQSDRIDIYYEYAERLLREGKAYVCTCEREEFKRSVRAGEGCKCRDLPPDESLSRWESMLSGGFEEGEAVLRVKTDMKHPNPAVRDWPAFRIIDTKRYPHPRVGSKYRVWPLYNFSCGVDDHLLGITHIIRGKEHLTNQVRQMYLYNHLGWEYPEAIHYGRLKIENAVLSKSKIVEGVQKGIYTHWSDPRLATFQALRRRGITPESIRKLILEVGPKTVDVTLSWENLYAHNRKILDPQTNRYFFVDNPKSLIVFGVPHDFTVELPLHPDRPERGFRRFEVTQEGGVVEILFSARDMRLMREGDMMRLKGLFNLRVERVDEYTVKSRFVSEGYEYAKRRKLPLIHWIPNNTGVPTKVVMTDNSEVKGVSEDGCRDLKRGDIIQYERFGFVRIDDVGGEVVTAFYAHR